MRSGRCCQYRGRATMARRPPRRARSYTAGLRIRDTAIRRVRVATKLATRMERLGTETAFEVLVRAKALEAQGKDVIHLEIGEPDFDTPANIIDAGAEALRSGWTHYGPAPGMPQLREV